ncbi:membrane protein [Roseivirga seohaensis subsp. aquiponti]|uniref:Membrane protein n=1 Tax=Roseivirga seohaensis subsp. aquiponti TaxID=1566026 RepID=A0A0L8APM3_9BACT|nr:OmpA family protein [Roseivirga seohaensis]KOF04428.1 membrane protein [Roseivirga seohaensis subsp. aquiponti]
MKQLLSYFSIVIVLSLSSCVAKKDFDALMAEKNGLASDKAQLERELAVANEKINRLEVQLNDLTTEKNALQNDFDIIDKELKALRSEHGRIKGLYENLLTNSGQLNQDLARQQKRLLAMEEDLNIQKKRNEELAEDLSKREARVAELEKLISDKEAAVQALKNKVTNALLNFNEDDLKVEVRNGKVYVSLAEQLLFGTGSIAVDQKGVSALQQLANAIKTNPDINIMVEGHTDNVPFSRKTQYMSDNWDLSVLRATSIVRILVEGGVSPTAITASGRGESTPVVANDSPENKAKNRRTEIILTPKLDELFQILDNY